MYPCIKTAIENNDISFIKNIFNEKGIEVLSINNYKALRHAILTNKQRNY